GPVRAGDPRNHARRLVEEQERGRELHLQARRQLLLGGLGAIDPRHFPVAPDVEGDRVKVLGDALGDVLLPEAVVQQAPAVGAAVLAEVEHEALAGGCGIARIAADVEEGRLEDGGKLDGMRRGRERGCRTRTEEQQPGGEHRKEVRWLHDAETTPAWSSRPCSRASRSSARGVSRISWRTRIATGSTSASR